ncbi:MAG: hypothetical protein IT201_00015 [Thermoleophilia bacterium]|nr:hypothetical protein [Thermoleophilia bacterium]
MAERFAISYGRVFGLLAALIGMGSRSSGVELDGETLCVRMGWVFRAEVPRGSVVSARRGEGVRLTRGVHGWCGDWLVNGGGTGMVELGLDPAGRGSLAGVSVRVERLRVSLEDPGGFLAAVRAGVHPAAGDDNRARAPQAPGEATVSPAASAASSRRRS